MEIRGRIISRGKVFGEVLLSKDSISFLGGVDPKTGMVIEKDHSLEGQCISNKILVFPVGKGSTVGSYVLLQLKKNNKAPLAIINLEAEPIIAVGAIISKIPMLDKLEKNPYEFLKNGQEITLDAENGVIIYGRNI
ncbi:MAG: DUF126 domain-containing protein [Candidatus ainarchaeum sp.]|nr:DUF126 domain-containing protein [Candidatus ainarchaeum sp.]